MFPYSKTFQKHTHALKRIGALALLLLFGSIAAISFASPTLGAADVEGDSQAVETRQSMMGPGAPVTSTMPMAAMPMASPSMAEMGAMMDAMMAQMNSMMASMPMSGTMPMAGEMPMTGTMSMTEMGQMMQMMGMMHQMMGQMQMMMGTMMSGHMMGGMMGKGMMMGEGMMGEGMMGGAVIPDAADDAPPATATAAPPATDAEEDAAASQDVPKDDQAEDAVDHPTATLNATPQSATAGAITVKASPLVGEELLEIAFAIALETHSVELDFDLAARATLTIGNYSFPATEWAPDAPDGHHVAGTLYFTIDHAAHAALAEVDAVTLDLKDLDGQRVTLHFTVE